MEVELNGIRYFNVEVDWGQGMPQVLFAKKADGPVTQEEYDDLNAHYMELLISWIDDQSKDNA